MADNKNEVVFKSMVNDVEEIENITVDELVQGYKQRASESGKKLFLEAKIKTVKYMDYVVVQSLCDNIIANSFIKDGEFYVDSCKSYYLYVFTILKYYTNIKINDHDFMREFDLLNEEGLIDIILNAISENLMNTFDAVFQMKKNDFMTNYYEVHSYMNRMIGKLIPVVSTFLDNSLEELKGINWEEVTQKIQDK